MFIPALTSIKTTKKYEDMLNFLVSMQYPSYMISAYDLYYQPSFELKSKFFKIINENRNNKKLFLDSGGFEVGNSLKSSKWSLDLLAEVANTIKPDVLVAYDEINSPINKNINKSIQFFKDTKRLITYKPVCYEIIIHSNDIKEIENYFDYFLEKVNLDDIFAICIPERELGHSFGRRCEKLIEIIPLFKKRFLKYQIKFHLMGCSNPLAIKKYQSLGVGVFDGVHWQDTLIEPGTYNLMDDSWLSEITCDCKACLKYKEYNKKNQDITESYYNYFVLSHNMEIYSRIEE